MNKQLLALICILFILMSCSDDKNSTKSSGRIFYPLSVGNTWTYYLESDFVIKDSENAIPVPMASDYHIKIITNNKITLHDSIKVYELKSEERLEQDSLTFHSYAYYNEDIYGLYQHAYLGTSHGFPKQIHNKTISFKGLRFSSAEHLARYFINLPARITNHVLSDSLYYENPPLRVLKYPLEQDDEWIFREPENPWAISKKVISENTTINVTGGTFECYEIQVLFDLSDDGQWDDDIEYYEYYNSKGLIKKDMRFYGLIYTDINFPEPLGSFDLIQVMQLVEYEIE